MASISHPRNCGLMLDSALPSLARFSGERFACECHQGAVLREREAHSLDFLSPRIMKEALLIVKNGTKLASSCVPGFLRAGECREPRHRTFPWLLNKALHI